MLLALMKAALARAKSQKQQLKWHARSHCGNGTAPIMNARRWVSWEEREVGWYAGLWGEGGRVVCGVMGGGWYGGGEGEDPDRHTAILYCIIFPWTAYRDILYGDLNCEGKSQR